METWLFAFLIHLAPARPHDEMRQIAHAIASVTNHRDEALALAVIDYHETSLNIHVWYQFGLSCCVTRAMRAQPIDLTWAAGKALEIYRAGIHECHDQHGTIWRFNTGDCPTRHPPARRYRVDRARWFRGKAYVHRVEFTIHRLLHPENRLSRR